jgi:diguanylate cyclase (GGDEF)-like protein/PAS domain S-box-containing protein
LSIDDEGRQGGDSCPLGVSGRAELVSRWAKALRTTAYVPASSGQIQGLLEELLAVVVGILGADEFCPDLGREVGKRLVTGGFTGQHSLSRTIEVLGQGLPVDPELWDVEDLADRVVSLLGAVAAGYATGLRDLTLDQQEEVKQALLLAKEDAERGLRVSEAKFRELFISSAVGIAISDLDGQLVEINKALREIVGESTAELARRSVYELFDTDDAAVLRSAHRRLAGDRTARCRLPQRLRLIDKDGEPAWTYLALSLLHDAEGQPAQQVTIVEGVTELHLLGERLAHQSLHDTLTGLPNQQFFLSNLERVLGRASPAARITVYAIDVDHLAVINDGFGREVGDQVLCSVAGRLQSIVSDENAMVARLGSDEFAILVENSATTPDVVALAAIMNNELARPLSIQGDELVVSGCIGVAEHHGGGGDPVQLLRAAEAALHDAKSSGPARWGLLDLQHDADQRRRSRVAAALPGAWNSGEIGLLYQPLAQLIGGKVIAVEALLRWDHPQSGSLCQHECWELAARAGLEMALGQWLLRSACAQLSSWRQRFGEVMPAVHVDFTPQQLQHPELVTDVRRALDHTQLPAKEIQIGVPVGVLDTEASQAADNVRALAEMGIAVVLLGFNGVSHLAHLTELPIQAVEIAHRIVQQVAQPPAESSPVTSPVADLLHRVHLRGAMSIVRGIQTQDQAHWWRLAGADVGQGTFCAPPESSEQIMALLSSHRIAHVTDIGHGGVGHP